MGGMCIATDGRLFMGMWRQSAMHGVGKYVWPDGKEYSGQYWFDKKDGFGILKDNNGEVSPGFWSQGAKEECSIADDVQLDPIILTLESCQQGPEDGLLTVN